MMNKKLESRLINYKFESAANYLQEENDQTKKLVLWLSERFGNCGWISGDFEVLINAALESIGVTFEE